MYHNISHNISNVRIFQLESDAEQLYEIEKLLKMRVQSKENGVYSFEFRVKWRGYSSSSNTWEPFENIEVRNSRDKLPKLGYSLVYLNNLVFLFHSFSEVFPESPRIYPVCTGKSSYRCARQKCSAP